MCDYEMFRRRAVSVLTVIAVAAVGALLVFAASACTAALRRIGLERHWSVSKIEQGVREEAARA